MLAQSEMSWIGALAVMIGVGLILAGSGWAVAWSARKTASGALGRNGWAGIRTRSTRSSDEAWLAAHKAGEKPTVLGGRACTVTGGISIAAALLLGENPDEAILIWGVVIGAGTAILLALVLYGAWLGQRAAREVEARNGSDSG